LALLAARDVRNFRDDSSYLRASQRPALRYKPRATASAAATTNNGQLVSPVHAANIDACNVPDRRREAMPRSCSGPCAQPIAGSFLPGQP
jgi:hypothetical protein